MKDTNCVRTKDGELYNVLPKSAENVEVKGSSEGHDYQPTHSSVDRDSKVHIS